MNSSSADAVAEAVASVVTLTMTLARLVLTVVVPALIAVIVIVFTLQRMALNALFDRVAEKLFQGVPIPPLVQFSATVLLYALALAPAALTAVLLAMDPRKLFYSILVGAAVGGVIAAIRAVQPSDEQEDTLTALRFW